MTKHIAFSTADYERIEAAIRFLDAHADEQPELGAVAQAAGLSEFHFQRLFTRYVGISPKRYLQYLTLEHAKTLLAHSRPVLDAAFETGLSGPGRLHDLFVTYEAMTPGEYRRRGADLEIAYGVHPSPFGDCLLLLTERGLCGLGFADRDGRAGALSEFRRRWPAAHYREAPERTAPLMEKIFARVPGADPLRLLVRGTAFQLKVWEALLRIPPGAVTSYTDLAAAVGRPGSARAVGGAVGANPVSFLVPCHRVIRDNGTIHGYEWGVARKRAILAWEAARFGPVAGQGDSEGSHVA
jgi:AraC family transcriptional regulator, regulatory protein of adaptative response / methylated-DNA-[protein]-cysteine methyltransferase